MTFDIAGRPVGDNAPVFVIGEIGINHNGDTATALRLVDAAADAGCDAVKMQVGDPTKYVNASRWHTPRETPWGTMPYIEYRKRMEFSDDQLRAIQAHANDRGIVWFASALDTSAVDRLEGLNVPAHKVASPMLTDLSLLRAMQETGKPVILSSGMSTLAELDAAVNTLKGSPLVVLHCTSAYPCPPRLANLKTIGTLRQRYGLPVGFSGHEKGVPESVAAVALGACVIERHLTLDRAMWGSDHAASLEPEAMRTLVRYIRTVEEAMGDGVKQVYAEEAANAAKFRKPSPVLGAPGERGVFTIAILEDANGILRVVS